MTPQKSSIQAVFSHSWNDYIKDHAVTSAQEKAALSIIACKSGALGHNISICDACGHQEIHNNSCRNRHCPNCQAVLKELWIDARRSEVIDGAYFHVIFTVPAELNPVIYANQKLLYSLLHDASAQTLLELSGDKKYLGAMPAIIQVLHTWGQTLNYHPHIHCIISGAGLTPDMKLVNCRSKFLIPVRVLGAKFKGKFMDVLDTYHKNGKLYFPADISRLRNSFEWCEFRDRLYKKDWCPYIKETFNGFGNAIDYLGRYTHRIAISNSRIVSVTDDTVSFRAKDYRTGKTSVLTISHVEFIRRFLQHVLPKGFQKIRYYGLLANSMKKKRLGIVFRIQDHRRFKAKYAGMETDVMLYEMFKIDIHICPCCGKRALSYSHRTFRGTVNATG